METFENMRRKPNIFPEEYQEYTYDAVSSGSEDDYGEEVFVAVGKIYGVDEPDYGGQEDTFIAVTAGRDYDNYSGNFPVRPLVSDSVPPEECLDSEYDISAGSMVYSRDGSRDVPYVLIEAVNDGEVAEGTVYTVKNKSNTPANENFVAKIYAPEYRTKRREAKIREIISTGLTNSNICFPTAILTDKNGIFAGYLMAEAHGMKLSEILDKLRKHEEGYFFSDWKRSDIAELILSILKGVKYLHDNNILIGNISLDNIMAESSREVCFIGADSFQILCGGAPLDCLTNQEYLSETKHHVQGFPCAADRLKYNSPEYQEALREYEPSEIFRTKGDELFALSVLLFNILMMGKWPYERKGMPPIIEAKRSGQFFYPSFFLTRRIISQNRTQSHGGIPEYGLANLPEGYVQMWDHLTPKLKRAFIDTFALNGSHSSEHTRFTADEWLEHFTVYSNDLKWWAGSDYDPANAELFPSLFYKPKYKTDEYGSYIRTEDGRKIETHYVECRLCHDLVEAEECSGKYNDECSLCWEEGTRQICENCGVEFVIKPQEAESARRSGNPLRRLCDDCMDDIHHCSEGHTFRVSRRIEDELYWKFRDSLWRGVAREDRDYSPYCPECLDVVMCEICHEPVTLSKQARYNMEKNGEPFSTICQHCMIVTLECEECGCKFEVEKHVQDRMIDEGRPFSEICPDNPEVEAKCERCGHVFTVRKHVYDRLCYDGRLFTICPKGEIVQVECSKCGHGRTYGIEAYWAEELQSRGELYDCGNHKMLGIFGSSGSIEPSVNHREN